MYSEKGLHTFGTQLPLLELDDAVPSKKPVYAQDQIATDDQGRRRFHGAFTGGFSAGYWNTVGSKEGWTPQSFKSSRSEKANAQISQRPEDFMDDEDRGEFGIAPGGLRIVDDYTGSETTKERKRKFLQNDMKPIPGEPVLQQLLKPIKDKVAVRILKAWGWRPGQGVGPRQTRKEKKKAKERSKKELYLIEKYGCEIPSTSKNMGNEDSEESDKAEEDSDDEEEITFAPEDFEVQPYEKKDDNYGIGYQPLSRQSVLGGLPSSSTTSVKKLEHINLFKPLEAVGKNNQKISFAGQGFGVGALEEDDDEDVYATDDLTRYDFTLENKKKAKKPVKTFQKEELVFEDFILDLNPKKPLEYKVEIPFGWQPRNWYQKKSRFEPLNPRVQRNLERQMFESQNEMDLEMTREKRANMLGEELKKKEELSRTAKSVPQSVVKPSIMDLQRQQKERQEKTKSLMEKISAKSSSFTTGGIITLDGEEKSMGSLTSEEISSCFKPFISNPEKQKRYELFLAKTLNTDEELSDFLKTIQPAEMSLWDRQMEKKEFIQAKKLYRPLKGIMSDRFVTESEIKAEQKVAEIQKEAAETKQVVVQRSTTMWKPHSLLCKRFNIAEPFGGRMEDEKKPKSKAKMSVFDYLETSVNKREDFQTPVIIPKSIERPQEIVKQKKEQQTEKVTKDVENTSTSRETSLEWQSTTEASLEWQNVLEGKESKGETVKTVATFKPKTDLERKVVETLDKPITEKRELFKSIFSDSESDNEDNENVNKELLDKQTAFINSLTKPASAAAANLLRNNSPPRGIFKALFNASNSAVDLTKEIVESQDLTKEDDDDETVDLTKNDNIPKEAMNKKEDLAKTSHEKEDLSKTSSKERIIFKPKSSREPKNEEESFNTFGPALPLEVGKKLDTKDQQNEREYGPSLPLEIGKKLNTPKDAHSTTAKMSLDRKLLSLWQKHKSETSQLTEVWVEKGATNAETSDESEDSSSDDSSTTTDEDLRKSKKKSKKSKKKKSSSSEQQHKHKKHKDHKSNKKSKKSDKKKKKHKRK